ncbi:MAG: DUF4339 domain-containing protein [Bacteroidetes bacterium]|nr:DUF4339 domain-containing protein [Bacteroidota bacterium]
MKKFYIHKDDQQQGPFSADELKDLKITRDTMVWFEGADNWKKAIEVDDLKEIFKSIPPPIQTNTPIIPPPLVDKKPKEESKRTVDLKPAKNNTTLIVVVIALLLVSGLGTFFYINQQAKQTEIQRQLEEQNAKIQEQEKIEAARLAEEERQKKAAKAAQRQAELESLKYNHDQAVTNLRAAKIRLNEIQQFQLLRTASEKQKQVQRQLETIRSWENEVDRLKKEIDKY